MIIVAHPHSGSFNHALAGVCCDTLKRVGHEIIFHDLYAEGFDPVFSRDELLPGYVPSGLVKEHIDDLLACDGLVFVHPNWWGQPPAMLKGWVDRIFIPKIAYDSPDPEIGDNIPVGLLREKRALVINTGDTPMDLEMKRFGDPLESTWLRCTFEFCGLTHAERRLITVITDSDEAQRRQWLEETAAQACRFFS